MSEEMSAPALREQRQAEGTEEHEFVLQKVQPALLGLMDGSVSTRYGFRFSVKSRLLYLEATGFTENRAHYLSTLAPLFAAAGLTHNPHKTFLVGLAASVGAGISMGLAEALSDDGTVTGRGNPWKRGVITGLATTLGGMLHTLPFLIPALALALNCAYGVVAFELLAIAFIRYKYMKSPLKTTILQVIVGGGIVFGVGLWLGRLGAGG